MLMIINKYQVQVMTFHSQVVVELCGQMGLNIIGRGRVKDIFYTMDII